MQDSRCHSKLIRACRDGSTSTAQTLHSFCTDFDSSRYGRATCRCFEKCLSYTRRWLRHRVRGQCLLDNRNCKAFACQQTIWQMRGHLSPAGTGAWPKLSPKRSTEPTTATRAPLRLCTSAASPTFPPARAGASVRLLPGTALYAVRDADKATKPCIQLRYFRSPVNMTRL